MDSPRSKRGNQYPNGDESVPMSVIQNATEMSEEEEENFDLDDADPMLPPTTITNAKGRVTMWKIICLALSLAGVQFTWSVEMAYGTPFLLSLGLSKSHMSLVWIAGPLSGLLMQPIVGAVSDRCTSRWGRRRPFMLCGSVIVVFSLILIGWTRDITALITSSNTGDAYKRLSIVIAVAAIYILDFSINCVQASCRALIVDTLPRCQQEEGTAWAGRMTGVGNVAGYFMGYVDLVKAFPILGNTQLKVLCLFAGFVLLLCQAITCFVVREKALTNNTSHTKGSPLKMFKAIADNIWNLPKPIQCICNVQFFAWMGWFPFLFYATTWVAEIYDQSALQHTDGKTDDALGQATRAGSFSFLVYSIVSLVASIILPLLISPSHNADTTKSEPTTRITVFGKQLSFTPNKLLKIPFLTLPRAWTASHAIFCLSMLCTIFASDVAAASVLIGICGISWALTIWAPFSLLGEYISRTEESHDTLDPSHPLGIQPQNMASKVSLVAGGAGMGIEGGMYQLVDRTESTGDDYEAYEMSSSMAEERQTDENDSRAIDKTAPPVGILLGIHNMYIVMPQFLVTFFCSIVFHFLERGTLREASGGDGPEIEAAPPNAIGFVLRFGAVMAGVAGYLSTKVVL